MREGLKIPELKRLKILSMGDQATGKSCLIKRFCEGRFLEEYVSTIGIDYGVKSYNTGNEDVKINFWDVAGEDIYFEVRNEFYKDTNGLFLVYDVSERSSFENLGKWVKEFGDYCGSSQKISKVVVGNKIDKEHREVGKEEGKEFADSIGAAFFETSALTGDGIQEMFGHLFNESISVKFPDYFEPKRPITSEVINEAAEEE